MRTRTTSLVTVSAIAVGLALTACTTTTTAATPRHSATATTPVTQLPASFPAHDVPLVDGRLIVARGDAADGWSVTVDPSDGNLESAEAALTKAGFTASRTTKSSATFVNQEYSVSVQTPGRTISYLVTKE